MKNNFPSENLLELITYEFNKVFHCCQAFRRYSHFLEMNLIEMQLQMNYWWIHFSLPFAFIFKIGKRGGNSPLFSLMVISPSSITRWNVTHSTFKFLWIFFTYLPFINYFQKLKKSSALPYHHCEYFSLSPEWVHLALWISNSFGAFLFQHFFHEHNDVEYESGLMRNILIISVLNLNAKPKTSGVKAQRVRGCEGC